MAWRGLRTSHVTLQKDAGHLPFVKNALLNYYLHLFARVCMHYMREWRCHMASWMRRGRHHKTLNIPLIYVLCSNLQMWRTTLNKNKRLVKSIWDRLRCWLDFSIGWIWLDLHCRLVETSQVNIHGFWANS